MNRHGVSTWYTGSKNVLLQVRAYLGEVEGKGVGGEGRGSTRGMKAFEFFVWQVQYTIF